ncbi:hypothetical protein [Accumulibacter sp.]|uniref:hypothetical protein n=1 Tax=Accumulibacter sp. TaxID=2053492 RepID=UPI0025DB18C2|nr:hypothetical protein [Accumulibacter sp.]MCM8596959.1 hypothetical protein [Accumulibacter sp.]MCM8624453.1 hypothetical protein [Accumulibacter sp.]MDS4051108.1 hypothetical protein [Accumulibacter sp.]
MAGFENYDNDTREIELEIERKGIALGIDWSDEVQVRSLAREALDHLQERVRMAASGPVDHQLLARVELFGLAGIMLRTLEESATVGIESHGGPAWKAFARALWAEAQQRKAPAG